MIPELLKQTSAEWVKDGVDDEFDQDLEDERVPCSLCHTDNRLVYHIVNIKNENRLNVGSHCVKKFTFRNRDNMGDSHLKSFSRKSILAQNFPGLQKQLRQWDGTLRLLDVAARWDDEQEYMRIGEQLEALVTAYLSGKKAPNLGEQIRALIAQKDALLVKINKYVVEQKVKNSPFTATRAIVAYLATNDRVGLKWLKMDGAVRARTAHRIQEPQFVRGIFPLLKSNLERQLPIMLVPVNSDNDAYLFAERKGRMQFRIRHADLLPYCGFLTDEENDELTIYR